MIDIDKKINKKLNLIIDRYLKLDTPFKDIEKYLTGKNVNKIINELAELEIEFFNKHKNKNKKDFKKLIKNKIKKILKDRKYNYMDKNESLKYIKLFEDIDWEFYDEEVPILNDIYDINNYKVSELYKMFNNLDKLIRWLNTNLKGKTISIFNNHNNFVLRDKIFKEINLAIGVNDKKINIAINNDIGSVSIFLLNKELIIFLSDTIIIKKNL